MPSDYMSLSEKVFGRRKVREWLREANTEISEQGIQDPIEVRRYFETFVEKKYHMERDFTTSPK